MNGKLIGVPVAGIALLAAGLATGTKIYYGLFAVLIVMLLYSVASVVWTLATAQLEMNGARTRAIRGETILTILTVRHSALFPVGAMTIVMNVPGSASGTQEITVNVSPYKKHRFRNIVRCPHRGEYTIGISEIRVEDIFGMLRLKRKVSGQKLKVTVVPLASEVEPLILQVTDVGPEFRSSASEDNAAPSDIRAWQDGDELKKVHWKLTFRKRELMVRTFEESARPDTLVIPDVTEITALRDQRLTMEDCVCESALSQVKAQLGAGFPVCMPLQAKAPMELTGRWSTDLPSFTDALTRVRFDSPYSYEQLLLQMSQRLQRTGGVVLITCRLTSRVADIAIRMQMSSVRVRLLYITDAPRKEALEMMERIKMAGVQVEKIDPRAERENAGLYAKGAALV